MGFTVPPPIPDYDGDSAPKVVFERLLGRPADVEVAVDEVMWRINDSAWLYVVVDPDRAGRGLVALSVADLAATLGELERRGIRPHRMEEVGGGPKATLLDADAIDAWIEANRNHLDGS